jgi:hypothetical protein
MRSTIVSLHDVWRGENSAPEFWFPDHGTGKRRVRSGADVDLDLGLAR